MEHLETARPILSVENLAVRFGEKVVLDGLSFDVRQGSHCNHRSEWRGQEHAPSLHQRAAALR